MNWMKITPPDGRGLPYDTRTTSFIGTVPLLTVEQVDNAGALQMAQADVENVEVPGRSGDLLLSRGRYRNVERVFRWYIKNFLSEIQYSEFRTQRKALAAALAPFMAQYCKIESNLFPNQVLNGRLSGLEISNTAPYFSSATVELTFDCMPQIWDASGLAYTTPWTIDAVEAGSFLWPYVHNVAYNFYGTTATPAWKITPQPNTQDPTETQLGHVIFRYGVDRSVSQQAVGDEPCIDFTIYPYPVEYGSVIIDTQSRQIYFDGAPGVYMGEYVVPVAMGAPNPWPVLYPNGTSQLSEGTYYETNWIRISKTGFSADYSVMKRGWTL